MAMTPMEKAENALNTRIEQFQAKLQQAESELARRSLVQAIVVFVGIGEAITHYVHTVSEYAKSRFAERKQEQAALTAQHADLLKSGTELLDRLKASPTDRALRKEIERTQTAMASIQKILRRGADTLQRELAPSVGLIDKIADSLRRLCEAQEKVALQRATKQLLNHAQEVHRAPTVPPGGVIDPASWEKSALVAIAEAADFYDAQARAGYQALLALEVMTLSQSDEVPQTAEETTQRANTTVAQRLTAIAARFTG